MCWLGGGHKDLEEPRAAQDHRLVMVTSNLNIGPPSPVEHCEELDVLQKHLLSISPVILILTNYIEYLSDTYQVV